LQLWPHVSAYEVQATLGERVEFVRSYHHLDDDSAAIDKQTLGALQPAQRTCTTEGLQTPDVDNRLEVRLEFAWRRNVAIHLDYIYRAAQSSLFHPFQHRVGVVI